MTDDDDIQEYARPCPNCEYHKNRAARWRAEAYAQAGHDIIERPWVGLTEEEIMECLDQGYGINMRLDGFAKIIEAKLKEKNT
jgi:hypothetical protein